MVKPAFLEQGLHLAARPRPIPRLRDLSLQAIRAADNWGLYKSDGVIRDLWAVLRLPIIGAGFVSNIDYGRLHFLKRCLVSSYELVE